MYGGTVEANVAKGYDLSEDGPVYTIHLREGMKWSDGTPFTATDCVYYYNYALVTDVDNETGKVTKSNAGRYYGWYQTADPNDEGKMKPDAAAAHWSGETDLKLIGGEGLPTITEEEAVANALKKSELYIFENAAKLGDQLGYSYWQYAGRPTLRPWNITNALTDQSLVFERNSYYWKVDAEGRQLPISTPWCSFPWTPTSTPRKRSPAIWT